MSSISAAPAASPPPSGVSLSTKLYYGFGSVAYGAKQNGLSYFLLIYYNQVLGLSGYLVGLILLIALLFDAVSDPLMGYFSDNWHSRWGRRHPFMYAAALPVAVAYFYLWNPPADLSQGELFSWGLLFTVLVRLIITAYEMPSTALVAELTDDYQERTKMLSFRYMFGWVGGAGMAIFSYIFLLTPNATYPVGQLNPAGYQTMGLVGGCVILLSIMVSSLGLHRHIPHLKAPPPRRPFSVRRVFGEIFETLSNRSFLAIFASAIFIAIATGISTSLTLYMMTYFWEFRADQIGYLTIFNLLSAFLALGFTPYISKMLGKKRAAIVVGLLAFTFLPLPVFLRLLGWFPENGTDLLLYVFGGFFVMDITLIISVSILIASMVADLAEDSEITTGRRSEGLFFASQTFALKALVGVGTMASTVMLAFIGFPEKAVVGELSDELVRNLGLAYGFALLFIYTFAILILARYQISETRHQENLDILKART